MRLVLLQHGGLASLTGKTGLAMLRHRAGPIVAVIDPAMPASLCSRSPALRATCRWCRIWPRRFPTSRRLL